MSTKEITETVLIIEDEPANLEILAAILEEDYKILKAHDGLEALDVLKENENKVACIICDIVMPVMDGYAFLSALKEYKTDFRIPVIVATADEDTRAEETALELGAWDFIVKPYNPRIIKIRVKNAIVASQRSLEKELKFLSDYDSLTRIYNKEKFFIQTRKFIDTFPNKKLALIRFDIDRFQLVNNIFGEETGDGLLVYISDYFRGLIPQITKGVYGRIYADVFALAVVYKDRKSLVEYIEDAERHFKAYKSDFDISTTVGVYLINDRTIPVSEMLDRATIAAKPYKESYVDTIGFYCDKLSEEIEHEQEIINEMTNALSQNQFQFYLQPKYSLATNTACGAEALVRWIHPDKGMISPGAFIPIFEKNGFISKLDFYMWEGICRYLRKEIDEGRHPFPISVNISRINMYNPHIVEILCDLIARYNLTADLLQLEITESAYMDNPEVMRKIIRQLQSKGFAILMDDFGNGYSSLSVLKDVSVDILKIDMMFMQKSQLQEGRSESVLAAIIRMAKWLHIPVIAEGVERADQVEFLRSVGCEYIQGFYFGRPMPGFEYNELLSHNNPVEVVPLKGLSLEDANSIWKSNADMELLFDNAAQATCLFSFDGKNIEILRVNPAYVQMFGPAEKLIATNPLDRIEESQRPKILDALRECESTYRSSWCEYRIKNTDGQDLWIHNKIQLVTTVGNQEIFCASLMNVTFQKELESKLERIELAVERSDKDLTRMLIVDDDEISCELLKDIFREKYDVHFEISSVKGLEYFRQNMEDLAVVLLDMRMPELSGEEFLAAKRQISGADDVPVIVISSDSDQATQIKMLEAGASDYITKPFFRELLQCRVNNVLQYSSRFRKILRDNQLST